MIGNVAANSPTASEDELLRCCARVRVDDCTAERIEQLASRPLDWNVVFERSWWHRIRPLTYQHLCAHVRAHVPDRVLGVFGEHVAELNERNRRLYRGLLDVASYFEQAGIRLLTFKGPTLAIDAYGDLSLRECGDIDLLLHRNDLVAASDVLRSHGFEGAWDVKQPEVADRDFACEFNRPGVQLDVHWDLAPGWLNYRVDFDELWESGIPLVDGMFYVRKIRPEDSMAVLCVHGAKHWWERLRWIGDIAELINGGQIDDWDRVELAASRVHSRRSVHLGLWLARSLLGARLPEEVDRRLRRLRGVDRLGRQVACWLERAEQAASGRSLRDRFSFRMGLCERWRDRAPQIWRYLRERPAGSVSAGPHRGATPRR